MRVVIVGAGEVGAYLAKFLVAEHHDVTMVDNNADKLEQLGEQIDLRTFHGSGASVAVLEKAETAGADLLLAMTDSDEINMLVSFFGKQLGARQTVARVTSEDVLTGHPGFYRRHLGMDMVVNPAMHAAAEATGLILAGSSRGIAEFGFGRIHCRSFDVVEDSPFTKKPLKELHLPGALVAAIARGEEVRVPGGDDEIAAGDRLVVICRQEAIQYVRKGVGESTEAIKRLFIVGGGEIGRAVAQYFDNPRYLVKLFEEDTARAWELAEEFNSVKVFDSDGLDADVLEEEYIETADAFIASTGSDEKNLMACALAKERGVKRTIAVVDNPQYTDLGHKMGLTATLAPRLLAAGQILTMFRGGNVNRVSLLAEGKAEVIEFQATANSKFTGKPLQELGLPRGVIVGGILHGSKAIIPDGRDEIKEGDMVILFAMDEQVPYIENLLKHEKHEKPLAAQEEAAQ